MQTLEQEVRDILVGSLKKEIRVSWRSKMRSFGHGERKSTHRGHGDDFDSYRPYEVGDDVRRIDQRVLATMDELVIREYRPPTQLEAIMVVDVSRRMTYGTRRATKKRVAAELVASCARSLNKTKDRVGALLFSPAGFDYIRPRTTSERQAYTLVTSVLQSGTSHAVKMPAASGNGLAQALKNLPARRSLVFIFSDFHGLSEDDWTALRNAGSAHDIVCFFLQDERERALPKPKQAKGALGWLVNLAGYVYMLEDFDGERRLVWNTAKTRAQYAANFRAYEAAITTKLKESFCRWLVISTEENAAAFPKLIELFG